MLIKKITWKDSDKKGSDKTVEVEYVDSNDKIERTIKVKNDHLPLESFEEKWESFKSILFEACEFNDEQAEHFDEITEITGLSLSHSDKDGGTGLTISARIDLEDKKVLCLNTPHRVYELGSDEYNLIEEMLEEVNKYMRGEHQEKQLTFAGA